MEGTTLKTWRLGKKLGSGACSDVYAVESVNPLGSDAGRDFVMKLSPLPQLPAAKLKNKKRKKTPAERNADALYAEHLLYKNHLRDQPGIPYVPMGGYGEDKGYRYLVIERLGRTLETVLMEQGPVPSATAARLGLEILETLQQMHVKNILYVDVKPENFMLDTHRENKVYCVDFGISDRYVTATGKHKDYKEGTVVGTPTFLSLSCHNGATSSRRDDIESLLYVLIYLMRGDLPWQQASSDAEGAKIKKTTSVEHLCASLPSEWSTMLKQIRECGFEDRPDYDFYVQQFSRLGGKKGLTTPFEWGARKTSKAAAKVAAASQESTTDSPVRKRVKSVDEDLTAPPPTAAKAKKATAPEKKKTTPRHSKQPKKASAPASKVRKTNKKDQKHDDDDVEVEGVGVGGVRPQDREVFKAIAGHAAATAAVKRYNLRSAR
ncbi:CK1/CK1 protein kinase, variant 1 [Phytophthora nicotianae CJ01A1]|uniref:Casein kinase I n=4 Tax=Phytophthora nicotianae TaxID=4792 RepID=W2PHX5_PHYN3|nr:CK1/CK1 protein kinase, variant 1 [Phytophthora nicotianae INRA-310]ETK71409.1 CK1/CK1 protein kinase, variant 1 [Phytophthora nicotianae]ETP00823.1 CK1/CK1 protein kinase, variant 1 [Phytophthora nicotianae CJ01A1]ETP28969.1 CK1/CK1 protein kinase, variant 1 [Phytophthora nicotianae P10297]KUF76484.1 Casein kinase I isoform epsilon [Phytophthora nicotianae]ETL24848.1 CK1/CK1 protein kinase, variant 1 [Phytophthora nicotianae]